MGHLGFFFSQIPPIVFFFREKLGIRKRAENCILYIEAAEFAEPSYRFLMSICKEQIQPGSVIHLGSVVCIMLFLSFVPVCFCKVNTMKEIRLNYLALKKETSRTVVCKG